jgi:hypothetical protein
LAKHLQPAAQSEDNGGMKVICAKCGEELLGAVNRCWKCGTTFETSAGDEHGPPVRRAPILELEPAAGSMGGEPVMAELADPPQPSTLGAPQPQGKQREVKTIAQGEQDAGPAGTSAGATPANAKHEGAKPIKPPTAPAQPGFRISHRYGGWLGALALLSGLASAAFSYYSFWALAGSLAGLVFGIWALAGKRRGAAMVGVILCCIALTISGYRALLVTYTAVMGYSPFDQQRPVEDVYPEPFDSEGGNDEIGEEW